MTKTKIIIFGSLVAYFAILNFLRLNYLNTTFLDDAYIFLRYAENIFDGYGFVWNINEPPVEGYTSFFYLVTLIIAKFLSIDLEMFAILLGIISSTLTLFLAYLIYDNLYSKNLDHPSANLITVIILALSPSYPYWSGAGMETAFYSMFLMLTIYFFLRLSNSSREVFIKGVFFGLLCIIRFEAVLFFLAALVYLMKDHFAFKKIQINKTELIFSAAFILIFGIYFIWRWNFFGFFLPNTFYAKTGGGLQQMMGGFLYMIKALRSFYGFAWIPLIIVIFFFKKNMFLESGIFLFSIGLVSIVTTILIGGDHFHLGRFVLPVLPLIFIIFPPALDRFLSIKALKLKAYHKVTALLVVLFLLLVIKPVYQESYKGFLNLMEGKKETLVVYDKEAETNIIEWQNGFNIMGKTLKRIASKDEYIAVVPIGAIGYLSKINVIDMVGLVDPVIAHEQFSPHAVRKWTPGHTKGDGKYILSRKPKYIQLTDYLTRKPLEKPHNRSTQFVSVKELWESEEFHQDYEFYPIEVIDGWYYNLFKRKYF
ncbi:MAG: glycosyltransferase family 39 protein [Ignavibacteriaceae bacterium]|nr:glycosyltransferase family 39 protein [Ignavibacteriaceae bacterium]